MHIAELGAVIVQKALRAFAPCRNHRHASASASTAGMPNVSISEAIKRRRSGLKSPQFHFRSCARQRIQCRSARAQMRSFYKALPPARRRQSYTKTIFRVLLPQELQGLQSVFHAFAGAQCGNRRQAKMCRVFRFFCAAKCLGVADVRQNFGRYIVFFF